MSELFMSLLFPVRHFAFAPIACAIVAGLFTACTALPESSRRMRVGFAIIALMWWLFAWLESTMSVQTNIRVDLLLLGPILQIAAYTGIWMLFRWFNRVW
jgi:hypothetical protein